MEEKVKMNKPEEKKVKKIDRDKVNTVGFVFMLPVLAKQDNKV